MDYTVTYHKRVVRFLNRHPEIKRQFVEKSEIMEKNPYDVKLDIVNIEENYRRLRIGWYRFIYTINNNELLIFFIEAENRWDSYKKLSQQRWL